MSDCTPLKQCSHCKEHKTLDNFGRDKNRKDGLYPQCNSCQSEGRRRYYQENRDRVRASMRRWEQANPDKVRERQQRWNRNNPEKVSEKNRRWREAHPEQKREIQRRWQKANPDKNRAKSLRSYWANPDKSQERNRRWRQANPDKRRANEQRRRAREKQADGIFTASDIKAQYKRQKGRCYYAACGHAKLGEIYHIEHVIPLICGGSNSADNIVLSCAECNLSKGRKPPHEWPKGGRLL